MSDVAWDPRVHERYPLLSQSLLLAASGQLRNMATMGGNILQRTRCPYFRDMATACNKREPGSGCGAIAGFNRTNAVLGTSDHCIATHPSDLAVALAALDAVVQVQGSTSRSIHFADFHLLPGVHPEHENTLKPGELITAIDVPALAFAKRSTYLKVRDRASYAFALASAAVAPSVGAHANTRRSRSRPSDRCPRMPQKSTSETAIRSACEGARSSRWSNAARRLSWSASSRSSHAG